ncbi:MAG TPA: tRNA (adenosine(37)-N6)-threonylcarbamoyltransferase complex transferase subunit TsaD [Longimicrobiales bacterium]|nr:tRNA (adenosine(37)-N6)-threonylcarbamoyltransferase complex transferase subunit TsaD [Longimicrobiales bacterium]
MTVVLGLETSCDETSAAVLVGEELAGHVILSQDVHQVYGGVVPELAARHHLQRVDAVVDEALRQAGRTLEEVDALAVTAGPGLIGALLVGVGWAKAAAYALNRPLVAVHHMEAHLFGPVVEDPSAEPPFVALLVSGGHTLLLHVRNWGDYLLLGETRDDAAGEAFDKVAKMLGLPYPGGPQVSRLALEGDASAIRLPRPMLSGNQRPGDPDYYDVSFSGLKTAVLNTVRELEEAETLERHRADVAASFQEAVVDVLVSKTLRAVEETGCRRVLLGGGVSANRRLREEMSRRLGPDGMVFWASPRLSLDNGAMVARAGLFRLQRGERAPLDVNASANLPFPGLVRPLPSPDGSAST